MNTGSSLNRTSLSVANKFINAGIRHSITRLFGLRLNLIREDVTEHTRVDNTHTSFTILIVQRTCCTSLGNTCIRRFTGQCHKLITRHSTKNSTCKLREVFLVDPITIFRKHLVPFCFRLPRINMPTLSCRFLQELIHEFTELLLIFHLSKPHGFGTAGYLICSATHTPSNIIYIMMLFGKSLRNIRQFASAIVIHLERITRYRRIDLGKPHRDHLLNCLNSPVCDHCLSRRIFQSCFNRTLSFRLDTKDSCNKINQLTAAFLLGFTKATTTICELIQ